IIRKHDVEIIDPTGREVVGRVPGHVFDPLADEQAGPLLIGEGPVGQPRKMPHERVQLALSLPQFLVLLPEAGIVGLTHFGACHAMESYNEHRTSDMRPAWDSQTMANLLLIDDDPDLLAERVAHLFPPPAHRIDIARTAAEGLKRVSVAPPDVIL